MVPDQWLTVWISRCLVWTGECLDAVGAMYVIQAKMRSFPTYSPFRKIQ